MAGDPVLPIQPVSVAKGEATETTLRLVVMGRKRLPDVAQPERNRGLVAMVTDSAAKLKQAPLTPLLEGTWE